VSRIRLKAAAELGKLLRLLRRFRPLLAPHRGKMLKAFVWMIGAIGAGLIAPWPLQMVIDGVLLDKRGSGALLWLDGWLPADREQLLLVSCVMVVVVALLHGLCTHRQRILAATVGHRVVSDLRMAVFAKLQRLSLAFHDRRGIGDLLLRMTGDVTLLRSILVPAVLDSSSRVLILLGMLTLMAVMDPWLTLIGVASLPLLALTTISFGSRIRSVTRKQRRKEGKIASVAGEALASVSAVQAYSRESAVIGRFHKQSNRSLRADLKALRLSEMMSRIVEVTLAVGTSLVLWIGVRRALVGGMSAGELIVFLTYLRSMYRPIQGLVRTAAKASKATACAERVLEILESDEEIQELPNAVPAPALGGDIVFDRVTFGYDADRPVLRDVSFRIRAGEKLGLVGPSGSGKSTILALLMRLYEPQSGRILVDGRDIRCFTLESYRRQIGVVLHDPLLFGVTVEENILDGRPDARPHEVVRAARDAGADVFVRNLPEEYTSVLGERGASLSRGQQQRIALARAMLRDAPVMVFDEPTTGLDVRTEGEVLRTLSSMARGRTCVWIAHALNQILDCSRVMVLRDGRIAQDGAPSALLNRAGAMQELFDGAWK